MTRIKIISDGTISGSRITTEDGTLIEGITNAVVSMKAQEGLVLATFYVQAPILELSIPEEQIEEWSE
jgi:hypothetical protein